jgi:hypothetical protein
MHWFDPFGSVRFEDLYNAPPIGSTFNSVRYLFWDQEPLNQETVNQTLSLFVRTFPLGNRHFITSEHNSDFVDYVKNTYRFIPHYYFFHGWAALDWYRGYDRSFLMQAPADRTITATFISPNRIVAGRRNHRLLMFYHMIKNQMMNNYISFPAVCPAEGMSVQDAVKNLTNIYPDIESVYADKNLCLPLEFEGESNSPMHSFQLSLFKQCADSLLFLVTETVADGRRHHLTEKTFKPICLRMPFILVSTQGSLEYLRSYGFKTFDALWDESYDFETDDVIRLEKIAQILKNLDNLSIAEKNSLFHRAEKICQHNYDHFYRGGFESILWTELTTMIKEF